MSKPMSYFDEMKEAMEASIAYSRGELALRETLLAPPLPVPKPHDIAQLRQRLGMSQAHFAITLNVSKKTVQGWEQGLRTPSHASLRLLQLIDAEPAVVQRVVNSPRSAK